MTIRLEKKIRSLTKPSIVRGRRGVLIHKLLGSVILVQYFIFHTQVLY